MSAYVVDPDTINKILGYLLRHKDDWIKRAADAELAKADLPALTRETAQQIGQALYDMNIRAVQARYGDKDINQLPGSFTEDNKLRKFVFGPSWLSRVTGEVETIKAARCLIYQCSEGDVPEEKLFEALYQISLLMSYDWVSDSSAYENAKWA